MPNAADQAILEQYMRKIRLQAVKRLSKKPLDKRGIGRFTCKWSVSWGWRLDGDKFRPFVVRTLTGLRSTRCDFHSIDMRGLKRHNRVVWKLFRFLRMLEQCSTDELSPHVFLDALSARDIARMRAVKPNRKRKEEDLPPVVHVVHNNEGRPRTSFTEPPPPLKFIMELRQMSIAGKRRMAICMACRSAYNGPGHSSEERNNHAWWMFDLFSCPHNRFHLSIEPEKCCTHRAEVLVITQPGAEELLAKVQNEPTM